MGTTTVVRDIEYLSSLIEGKDKPINFGGWSYGTVMGQYLVSMFPDRVGRVMIDGVCDILNWVENPHDQWGRSVGPSLPDQTLMSARTDRSGSCRTSWTPRRRFQPS
jgi:pimeloyl-ACP methyl ester carboxylesterase